MTTTDRVRRARLCIAIAFSLLLLLSLAGCNDGSEGDVTVVPTDGTPEAPGDGDGGGDSAGFNAFTLAVLPDTQKYARYSPERYDVQTQWIADHYQDERIAFTVHLGDVVDIADDMPQWQAAEQSMAVLDANAQTPYSVLAGNHDVLNSGQQDAQRDLPAEPFLEYFSADKQAARFTTFQGTDDTGFNSYHIFDAAGRQFLVFALDWRASDASIAWARSVLDAHPQLPTIVTTHQLLNIAGDKQTAIFTDYGAKLWNDLIRANDQIFLTINGHHHGEATMVAKNDYGRDVIMEVVDYQSGFWGGNGMLQLASFDTENNALRFRSYSPWVAAIPEGQREPQDVLTRWQYSVPMDFEARFANFNQGVVADAPGNIDGTEAYWILDDAHRITSPENAYEFIDASGNGNTLELVAYNDPQGEVSDYFTIRDDAPPFGYAEGSATFDANNDTGGYYLTTTGPGLTFAQSAAGQPGYLPTYTIEAIVRLPESWIPGENQWSGILNHRPQITTVCEYHQLSCTGSDASLGLNVSSLKEFQWVSTSQNGKGEDNWSWEVDSDYWYHVALVNDGERVQMYVDGSLVMRTGVDEQQGLLVEPGQPWSIGVNSWQGNPSNIFAGDIAEIRINNRVLDASEWLYSQ